MAKYVIKRVAYGVVTLFVLVSLTFFMQQLLPGNPFVGEKNLPEATMEALYAKYGLDKPVWMQYFIYLGNVLHGDLGISLQNDRPVTTVIGESFVVSFDVGIRAILFAFILGVVLGTLAAIKRGTAVDTICMLVALVGVSVPSFIVASLLQYYLGMRITMALGTPVFATTGWDGLNSKILPVFALGFSSLAQISRLTRTSMLDVLGQDYIKTAKAKGLSYGQVIRRHTLKNAITPVITVAGTMFAGTIVGSFVVENIFNIPGMGKYLVDAVKTSDYTMIMGMTAFYAIVMIVMMFLVDILYMLIDPRVKMD